MRNWGSETATQNQLLNGEVCIRERTPAVATESLVMVLINPQCTSKYSMEERVSKV